MSAISNFFKSPLQSGYPIPLKRFEDWLTVAGAVLFAIAVFALPWIRLRVNAFSQSLYSADFSLFVSPWAWLMLVVLVAIIAGLWFVQTRGAIILGAGIFCLLFNIVFYVGARLKIDSIIGDIEGLARSAPIVGPLLSQLVHEGIKRYLSVGVTWGFYIFMVAGVFLVVGGAFRITARGG